MRFFEKIFGKKEQPIKSYKDFWAWFQTNERQFYAIMQSGKDPENGFFDKLSPKLEEAKEGLFYLAGMFDKNTAELIITPDGVIRNIVFVEELVKAAPSLPNWKFTALKPENKEGGFVVNMAAYKFSSENLSFYAIDKPNYPDEVNIVIIHDDYNEEDKSTLTNGVYIFLDTYLGELYSITAIDNLSVIARKEATKELIPMSKLKSYLTWREKEFVEKYNDTRHNTNDNMYSSFQAEHENGSPLVAIINTGYLNGTAKHPTLGF